ncbi:MAG: acyltransferase family protein [Cyanobium sp. ELA712]
MTRAPFRSDQSPGTIHHIEGIDYLRSVMSVFVVIWHMGGGGHSLIFSRQDYTKHAFVFSDFLNFHVLLLAVPVFIFISIYLFSIKQPSLATLRKRVARLALLLTFWPLILIFYNAGYRGLASLPWAPPVNAVYTIFQAGQTIYYFFPSLIVCLCVAYIFIRLNRKLQVILMLASLALLVVLPILTKISNFYVASAYWNPFNFVPLSFAAVLVAQNTSFMLRRRIMVIALSLLFSLFFSILEWRYATGHIFF